LFRGDEGEEHGFKPISNKLGYNFIDYIEKGYGAEVLMIINVLLFGNEGKEGGIEGSKDIGVRTRVFHHCPNIPFDYRLAGLREVCG